MELSSCGWWIVEPRILDLLDHVQHALELEATA